MGISREEFASVVKGMKAVFAEPTFIPDQDAFDVWYALLSDMSFAELKKAAEKVMMTSHFAPKPADLRTAKANDIQGELTEQSVFSLIRKAVQNATYHAEEEFEKLPPLVQQAVGNYSNLKEWALMDSNEFETIQQSQVLRSYRTVLERAKENAKVPEYLKVPLGSLIEAKPNELQIEDKSENKEYVPMPRRAREALERLRNSI